MSIPIPYDVWDRADYNSNAGGGGERVLWSAIAYLQAKDPDVVTLVYTGDYPAASKEEILAKIKVSSEAFSKRSR